MFSSIAALKETLLEAQTNEGEPLSAETIESLVLLAKPGISLSPIETNTMPLGASRIGGAPDMPADMVWPIRPALPDLAEEQASIARGEQDKNYSWADSATLAAIKAEATQLEQIFAKQAPLHFLAQINFKELAQAGLLDALPMMPRAGHLFIFYDLLNQGWGFDPKDASGFACLWYEGDAQSLTPRETPALLSSLNENGGENGPLPSRQLQAKTAFSLPDSSEPAIQALKLSDDEMYALGEMPSSGNIEDNDADHRLGGWPDIIQNPMETECALVTAGKYCGNSEAYTDPANADIRARANQWQFLMQIDTDEQAGFMWGDSGRLYLWIHKDDLAARTFEKAWLIQQCY